jgi:hypothetical protein
MPRLIKWTAAAHEVMIAGFRAGLDVEEICAAVLRVGVKVSPKVVYRHRSEWRADSRMLEIAREQGLAIAACEGHIPVLDHLAQRIIVSADWRAQREARVKAALQKFLSKPRPDTVAALQHESWMLLFEHQLWTYKELSKKLRSKRTIQNVSSATTYNGNTENTAL